MKVYKEITSIRGKQTTNRVDHERMIPLGQWFLNVYNPGEPLR